MNIYQSDPRKVAAKITGLKCSVDYETAATTFSDRIDYELSRNNLYNIVIFMLDSLQTYEEHFSNLAKRHIFSA